MDFLPLFSHSFVSKSFIGLADSDCHRRLIIDFILNSFVWGSNYSNVGFFISRHSYQISHIIHLTINKSFGTIDRINPYTNFIVRDLKITKFNVFRYEILGKTVIIYFNLSLIINSLLTNYFKLGEFFFEPVNNHRLNMIICLFFKQNFTSVTGSSKPFSYFPNNLF